MLSPTSVVGAKKLHPEASEAEASGIAKSYAHPNSVIRSVSFKARAYYQAQASPATYRPLRDQKPLGALE
jgi:hypothetical protein